MYQRGIMPPCEWPTTSTFVAPSLASTRSTNAPSWAADVGMSPVAWTWLPGDPP